MKKQLKQKVIKAKSEQKPKANKPCQYPKISPNPMRPTISPPVIVSLCYLLSLCLCGFLTPQHIQQHIKRLISQDYQLYIINLGKTANNNQLRAYVISGTRHLTAGIKKQQNKISQLTSYPATLITSYMHPREPYSIKLIEKVLDDVLNNYATDYYFKYMLDKTLLILFPFVNIDGYYRYQQLQQADTPQDQLERYRKNMHAYGKCRHQADAGVDINRNFDSAFGTLRTSEDQCGEEYRGPQPFSEKQSKAIKMLYKKFHITLSIDIHSYGNKWIYPYASQRTNEKLQKSQLYPLYEDLFQQFKQMKQPMESCFQSLGYTADGVYIDWALDQGALSFAIQIGTGFSGDNNIGSQILFQVEQAFHKVLRKNSISYSKALLSSNEILIQSTSLIKFQVQILLKDGTSLGVKMLESRQRISFKLQQGVKSLILHVKDTIVREQIQLSTLKNADQLPGMFKQRVSNFGLFRLIKIIIVVASVISLGLFGFLTYLKKLKQQEINRKKFSLPRVSQSQIQEQ